MSGPLAGVRVLDLSIALTGPYAAALMADQPSVSPRPLALRAK